MDDDLPLVEHLKLGFTYLEVAEQLDDGRTLFGQWHAPDVGYNVAGAQTCLLGGPSWNKRLDHSPDLPGFARGLLVSLDSQCVVFAGDQAPLGKRSDHLQAQVIFVIDDRVVDLDRVAGIEHVRGTAEDMFRCLPATNDTPAVGEHMLQYARQLTARPDLHYREIHEDMVGLRDAVKHANRADETHVDIGRTDVHRYLVGALMNAFRCGVDLTEAMTETFVRIADIEDALERPSC